MKTKILGLMCLSILVLVLVMGFGSAAMTFDPALLDQHVTYGTDSVTLNFQLKNDGLGTAYSGLNWSASTTTQGTLTLPTKTDSALNENASLSATLSGISEVSGTITGTINVVDSGTQDVDLSFTITIDAPTEVEACSLTGDSGDLMELEIEEITVTGFGEEDDEWVPLDEIEVEVRVENTEKDFKLEDVEIGWGLYNLDTQEWVFDEEESDFNIKDDEERTLTFTFTLEDPDEFEDGGNFAFYVWANAVGEEFDTSVCRAVSEDIEIIIDSDFLILGNLEIEGIPLDDYMYPTAVSCGSTLHLTADIWNIGDSNQEDIEIRIYNHDFGIDEILEIGDVDKFDSESISFEFTIPEGMEEGWNTLELTIQEDGDIFENDYVDEDAEFEVLLDLENCAFPQAFVSAFLDEGGKAGKELIVRATIKNTGSESTSYLVNAFGYAEWASSASVEPSTLILEAGQSADVLITLKVNRDVSGERLFNIEVVSEGELVVSQPLSVSIEKAFLGDIFGDNGLLTALIIGIAIILVIIIIVLAVRVARR